VLTATWEVVNTTQKIKVQKGIVTKEMRTVAREEGVFADWLREKIASGRVGIPANRNHRGMKPVGIGEGLRIKVNTNIGTSSDNIDFEEE
jgi:phosphomethylpyrimidine synthase